MISIKMVTDKTSKRMGHGPVTDKKLHNAADNDGDADDDHDAEDDDGRDDDSDADKDSDDNDNDYE